MIIRGIVREEGRVWESSNQGIVWEEGKIWEISNQGNCAGGGDDMGELCSSFLGPELC